MRHATRRTGAHRATPVLARDHEGITAPTHRRGTRRSERRYARALRQTPSLPFWPLLADPRPAEPVPVPSVPEPEPDTMIIRMTEKMITVARQRKSTWEKVKTYPDWWMLRIMVGAIGCGVLIAVLGIMPTGTVPDVPYGDYSRIVASEGIDEGTLSYWNRAEVKDRSIGR